MSSRNSWSNSKKNKMTYEKIIKIKETLKSLSASDQVFDRPDGPQIQDQSPIMTLQSGGVSELPLYQTTVTSWNEKYLSKETKEVIDLLENTIEALNPDSRKARFPTIKGGRFDYQSAGASTYVDEDTGKPILCLNTPSNILATGSVYNSSKFDDGFEITTSLILLMGKDWFMTRSGSIYNHDLN